MAQIIDNRTNIDKTIQIFDSFYSFNTVVNPTEYDLVHGYFLGVCSSKQVADNFTAVFFRIAQVTGLSVQTLLAPYSRDAISYKIGRKVLSFDRFWDLNPKVN